MPRNCSQLMGKLNEDLLNMDLEHSEINTAWNHMKKTSTQFPTNANSWTNFLKDLYNNGQLKEPVACAQKAQGACRLDETIVAGVIKK